MLGDTPVTVYWTMLYNSCILLIYSFCDSSHIVTKRSILFEFRLRLHCQLKTVLVLNNRISSSMTCSTATFSKTNHSFLPIRCSDLKIKKTPVPQEPFSLTVATGELGGLTALILPAFCSKIAI